MGFIARQGEDEEEAGSLGVGRVQLDDGVHPFGYELADAQAQTGALVEAVHLEEAVKDKLLIFRDYAYTLV